MTGCKALLALPLIVGLVGVAPGGWADDDIGTVKTVVAFSTDPQQLQYPEGILTDAAGNLYVGMFYTGDIWKIAPDGTQQRNYATFGPEFGPDTFNNGGGLVGFAFDEDGDLYVCLASLTAGTHGIWKLDRHGQKSLVALLPPMTNPYTGYTGYGFPNGIAFDEGHNMFVTDSWLSLIWKIRRSGAVSVWAQDPLLNYTCCYGANNDAIDRGYLYVTNTDLASVVRIKLESEGAPVVEPFVQSNALLYGADGISFDSDHNAYVGVDYSNLVVRIRPDRSIDVLATAAQGLSFAADTVFGAGPGQKRTLFWTNGGRVPSVQKLDVGVRGAPLPP